MDYFTAVIRWIHYLYWNRFLGWIIDAVEGTLDVQYDHPWSDTLWKWGLTLFFLFFLYETYARLSRRIQEYRIRKSMVGYEVKEPHTVKNTAFVEELDAAQYPVHTLEKLRQEKRYGRLGEIHAALNQPELAARWFQKDGQYQRAAEEWAKAGRTEKAARLLWRSGDYETSGSFYETLGRHRNAAAAFLKAGNTARAATAFAAGGYAAKSAACFLQAFNQPSTDPRQLEQLADQCYPCLQQELFMKALDPATRSALLTATACAFVKSRRFALAVQLYEQAGDTVMTDKVRQHMEQASFRPRT